jgi:phosphoribosyl 1,2-cyclic phosphate phosphodiesterase
VIDSGPDFRQQMLRQKVMHLDGIVYTHEHKDHVAGMDDVRAYNYKQQSDMQLYGSTRVKEAIYREFHYAFAEAKYPGIPEVRFNLIDNHPFELAGMTFIPIEVIHYQLPVQGFRINDITYITDANYIAPAEIEKIKGSRILILNALRKQQHPSHFNLHEALELIDYIQPEQAYLTHISHMMGKHEEVSKELPFNVKIAFDGLQIG